MNKLFFPDNNLRIEIYKESEKFIREKYKPNRYTATKDVTCILNRMYDYHYNKICELIRGVNIRDLLTFLLYYYEKTAVIDREFKANKLSVQEKTYWLQKGAIYRDTICYLCDEVVEKKPYDSSSVTYFCNNEFTHRLWIHAEYALKYSLESESVHRLYKEKFSITIQREDHEDFLIPDLPIDFDKAFSRYKNRINDNILLRQKYIQKDLDDEILDLIKSDFNNLFFEVFGFHYQSYEEVIIKYLTINKPIEKPKNIPCIHSSHIKEIARRLNCSLDTAILLLNGITLRNELFKDKSRKIWDYQQLDRTRKRPLIEIIYDGKVYSIYSPEMLKGRISSMAQDIMFSPEKLPHEWKNEKIEKAIANSSNKLGKWFENLNITMLKSIDIFGFKPSDKIQLDDVTYFDIKGDIGPPDYIGYSKNDDAIVLIECKLLDCAFEIKGICNEIHKFLYKKKSFVKQFDKKINFLADNQEKFKIAIEYNTKIKIPDNCKILLTSFVTYYPTIMDYFYKDCPITSIFELLEKYKLKNKWPFENGRIELK